MPVVRQEDGIPFTALPGDILITHLLICVSVNMKRAETQQDILSFFKRQKKAEDAGK